MYQQDSFRQAAGSELRPGGLVLTEELAAACALQAGQRVLDLGCGVGSTASYLRDRWQVKVWGVDVSPAMLVEARARDPQVEWVQGRAEAVPFPDGHFDAVFAECFLSGVADRPAALREIRRVLCPDGRLALSDIYLRTPEAGPLLFAAPATCLPGALGIAAVLDALTAGGFAIQFWGDRSGALKSLMASLIFAYGSETDFWKSTADEAPTAEAIEQMRLARPGYYLLVASATPHERATAPGAVASPAAADVVADAAIPAVAVPASPD